jgi:hypothetical protein
VTLAAIQDIPIHQVQKNENCPMSVQRDSKSIQPLYTFTGFMKNAPNIKIRADWDQNGYHPRDCILHIMYVGQISQIKRFLISDRSELVNTDKN